jgi:hypothetical protein
MSLKRVPRRERLMGVCPITGICGISPLKAPKREGFEPPAIETDPCGRSGCGSYDGDSDTPEDDGREKPVEVEADTGPGSEVEENSTANETQSRVDVRLSALALHCIAVSISKKDCYR